MTPYDEYPCITRALLTIATGGIVLLALLGCLREGGERHGQLYGGCGKDLQAMSRQCVLIDARRVAGGAGGPHTGIGDSGPGTDLCEGHGGSGGIEAIGIYTCYAYCNCEACCGQWSGGPTASGTMPEAGRTVAADWSVLPAGTVVYIDGAGWRTVEDTGAGITGQALDLYCASHDSAIQFGVQHLEVFTYGGG